VVCIPAGHQIHPIPGPEEHLSLSVRS
jgi:hypothetical protein